QSESPRLIPQFGCLARSYWPPSRRSRIGATRDRCPGHDWKVTATKRCCSRWARASGINCESFTINGLNSGSGCRAKLGTKLAVPLVRNEMRDTLTEMNTISRNQLLAQLDWRNVTLKKCV